MRVLKWLCLCLGISVFLTACQSVPSVRDDKTLIIYVTQSRVKTTQIDPKTSVESSVVLIHSPNSHKRLQGVRLTIKGYGAIFVREAWHNQEKLALNPSPSSQVSCVFKMGSSKEGKCQSTEVATISLSEKQVEKGLQAGLHVKLLSVTGVNFSLDIDASQFKEVLDKAANKK